MKKTTVLLLASLLVAFYCNAGQIPLCHHESNTMMNEKEWGITPLSKSELEQLRIPYNGMFINGVKWKDTKENHIVFYTATGLYESREDGMSTEIFAYHYAYEDNPNHAIQIWDFHETELNCPLAALLEFIDGSFRVTDLNNDGTVEIWLAWRGGCSGDITPWSMSIVMYDGDKEYKMDGEVKLILSGEKQLGGEYRFDENYQNGQSVFRQYADELWAAYCFYYDYSNE